MMTKTKLCGLYSNKKKNNLRENMGTQAYSML